MKFTGRLLYGLQPSPYAWDKTTPTVRKWWDDYAIRLNALDKDEDEQTDDATGISTIQENLK